MHALRYAWEAVGLSFLGASGAFEGECGGGGLWYGQWCLMLKLPASLMPSIEVALLSGGSLKSLYQSGRSTHGISRVEQKWSRSSVTLRFAVWPWCDTDRQKRNFQRYSMDLAHRVSSRGRCKVILDRSW